MMTQYEAVQKVLDTSEEIFSASQVTDAIERLAELIRIDYRNKNPIILCVMNGGLFFTSELCQRLDFPHQQDYLHATRYNGETRGSDVLWKAMPQADLSGRHVLILDDILDEGHTLLAIKDALAHQEAASVKMAVLTEKDHDRRAEGIAADYCGLTLPDRYVFGCGMDYKGYFRNLTSIRAMASEC